MELTVREIMESCGGRLLCGDPEAMVTNVVTDSRKVADGSLFVPLVGEKTNAHAFLRAAFAAGAAAVLTQEHEEASEGGAWIKVDSTLLALQQIAAAYRRRFNIPVIGITGSVGKTTTKEMVALALSAELNVMKTKGNQNSQVGLPLMMFEFLPEHQAAVVEMGMSDFGEMSRLSRIAEPQYAVMTNIGISHIGQLKTRENILSEKLHITDRFVEGSVLFLNGDDPLLAGLRGKLPFETVYYGTAPWCDFRAEDISSDGSKITFRCAAPGSESSDVTLAVPGMHHVLDALAGLAVAKKLGVGLQKAAAGLTEYRPLAMRQQIYRVNEITVIDDSYNASPDSVRSCLDVLAGFRTGRRVAVLADMLELGEFSREAHFEVGVCAAESGVDLLITVGEQAKIIAEGARSAKPELDCRILDSNSKAIGELKSILSAGDAVLVKGSRGMKTDEIVRSLL